MVRDLDRHAVDTLALPTTVAVSSVVRRRVTL